MRKLAEKFIDFIYNAINIFFEVVFLPLPVKSKRIVFINFNGRGYGCNPKYICQYLLNDDEMFELIWLVSKYDYFVPEGVKKVKYNSINALYNLSTANIIITNTKNNLRIIKKKYQKVIQTWHASYSPKYLEKAARLSKKYKKESKRNSEQTDYFLSNSRMQTHEYIENFWCKCSILEIGYPRNDILMSTNQKLIETIKKNIGIGKEERILLYAPTFRDDYKTTAYFNNFSTLKLKLGEAGNNWRILIRLHPNAEKDTDNYAYNSQCINVSKYPDMQELLMIADILVTDYSSSMFDFSIMKKPVFIYANDIEEYINLRGLKPIFYELPFPICTNENELLEKLADFSDDEYIRKVDNYMVKYGNFDDGHASENVCNLIKSELII